MSKGEQTVVVVCAWTVMLLGCPGQRSLGNTTTSELNQVFIGQPCNSIPSSVPSEAAPRLLLEIAELKEQPRTPLRAWLATTPVRVARVAIALAAFDQRRALPWLRCADHQCRAYDEGTLAVLPRKAIGAQAFDIEIELRAGDRTRRAVVTTMDQQPLLLALDDESGPLVLTPYLIANDTDLLQAARCRHASRPSSPN